MREVLLDWVRANHIDPGRGLDVDAIEVDLVSGTIRYTELADADTPGVIPPGPGDVWKRQAVAPLLVEPPDILRTPPHGQTIYTTLGGIQ